MRTLPSRLPGRIVSSGVVSWLRRSAVLLGENVGVVPFGAFFSCHATHAQRISTSDRSKGEKLHRRFRHQLMVVAKGKDCSF